MFRVYVIELKKSVLEVPKFLRANPEIDLSKPCLYVGSTAQTPEERLAKHLVDGRRTSLVRDHGWRLRSDLYDGIKPRMSRAAAEKREARLAAQLRSQGFGVWQK